MHRSIHKLWGFGALEDWEELSGSSPLNDPHLSTTLEMVLNRDGTVDKVTVVRASGYLPFDAAAIDVAFNAGPYPDPPRAIRSANGKIYVHWQFHRDERQCATSGVDYFILDNPPAGADRSVVAEAPTEAPHAVGAPHATAPATPATAGAATPAANRQARRRAGSPAARRHDRRRRPATPATLRRQAPPREVAAPRRGGRDGRGPRGRGAIARAAARGPPAAGGTRPIRRRARSPSAGSPRSRRRHRRR